MKWTLNYNVTLALNLIRVNCVQSEEYRELKAEIEYVKKRMDKLEKELLDVKRLAEKAYDAAVML
jgi:predicted  nucleic acid-binding Zn-ribbon protein